MNWKNRTGWQSFSINQKVWVIAGICLTTFLAILILPILPVQAAPGLLPDMQEEEQPEGYWQLTGSDASDTWQGDKFHGLESEYYPIYGGNSLGANYIQYNLRFNDTAPQTVASSLNGTCSWDWNGGFIPDKVVPGTNYPFSMTASANYDGSLLLGATVNAYTQTGGSNIAFAQAYLNVDGSNTSASNTASAALSFPPGQDEDESRSVTQLCQVDIVSVQQIFTYQWKETSCNATLTLPPGMLPDKEFTPQVSVVDNENKTVKPDKETWYYNEAASTLPMKWDGKEATVKYEYVCPGGSKTRSASVTIPKAPSCTATLNLPEKMVPDKEFTPIVSVLDSENMPVTPDKETWYYNDAVSPQTMKWDGKQAMVKYDYICPNETETKTVSITIPPAKTCTASIVLPDKMEADKEFTPRAEVVDKAEGTPVVPQQEKWYYNGELSVLPIKWDGKEAALKYEYLCPLDSQTLDAEKQIPPAEGGNFILVVGGLAAVAAAGLAAAGAGAMAIKGGPKQGKPPGYILQVDKTYLEVKPKDSVPIFIQVWKINPDGSTVPASDASIRVQVPAEHAGLAASPTSGTGSMTCAFSVPNPRECADVPVTVSATAGLLKTSAQVTVKIIPLYEMELSWADPQNNRLEPGGNEIYATATLSATPMPDSRTTADDLAGRITLSVDGPNSSFVQLSTATGGQKPYVNNGVLWIPLSLPTLPQGTSLEDGNPNLTASFTDGNQRLEALLPLEIKGEVVLGAWVLGKKQAEVIFFKDSDPPGWDVPEIVAYFHDPLDDSKPVHPGFEYVLDADCVKFDPDVLVVKDLRPHDRDQYTIQCEVNPSVNLEDAFGKDLDQLEGIVKVTITPKTNPQGKLTAEVKYQFRPQFELIVYPAAEGERTYKGVTFKEYEFLADSDDRLKLGIACVRTDIPGDRNERIQRSLDPSLWNLPKMGLGGTLAELFKTVLPEDTDPHLSVQIQADGPKLYKEDRSGASLTLDVEGKLADAAPPNYRGTTILQETTAGQEILLLPRFPNLKIWLVPGEVRNRTEVWMVSYLEKDPRQRLTDIILEVNVESTGSARLLTPDGDTKTSVVTSADGTEQVNLWYSGLNWSTYRDALFMVKAFITSQEDGLRSEEVAETFNIQENVSRLLADLLDRADMLKLNNPYYFDGQLGFQDLIELVSMMPSCTRGPIWNFGVMMSGAEAARSSARNTVQFMTDYTCNEFRDRIAEWLIARRHYQRGRLHSMEMAKRMNGIEFDHFTVGGVHQYEALFLSGMQPEEDPRGLDPWWHQSWKNTAYLDPEGLITNNWERTYSAETAATLSLSATAICLVIMPGSVPAIGGASVIIAGLAATYAAVTAGELGSKWEMGTSYLGGVYRCNRDNNLYTKRSVFIGEWAADQGG